VSGIVLGELVALLERMDPEAVLPIGFRGPHSWRGDYHEVAFEPAPDVKVSDMLADVRSAIGATFIGWRGGVFAMTEWSTVHLSWLGRSADLWAVLYMALAGGGWAMAHEALRAEDPEGYADAFGGEPTE